MKKLIPYSGVLIAGAVLLSGCSNAIPEMDEETKSMVVSYAADIVQKYDSNHPAKLQLPEDSAEEAAAEHKTEEEEASAATQEPTSEEEVYLPEETGQENEIIDNTMENSDVTLDSFLQFDNITFSFEGYETADFYPAAGTEIYFSMNSTEGNKLLILKFAASNQSAGEETLDMLQTGIRFKVQINGEIQNAQTTMLLNDFANYQGVIAQGESVELVVVCEIPDDEADAVESLDLIVKNVDETATILLL